MNKLHISLLLVTALAIFAVGCGDSTMTDTDAGGHPDLGMRDAGPPPVDMGTTPIDLGTTDTGTPPVDMGDMDAGTPVDGGPGHYTEAGCYEGTPIVMTDFLNHCTTTSTPAAVTGSGTRSTRLYPDGGVPPIP